MLSSSDDPSADSPTARRRAEADAARDADDSSWSSEDGALSTDSLRALFSAAVQEGPATAGDAPSAAPLLAERYELIERIGYGGMGQVWRARDRRLGHLVAVKVLQATARPAAETARLAMREGQLLARLSHPGVARILDAGHDGQHCFLVMDLVDGVTIEDALRSLQQSTPRSSAGLSQLVGPSPAGTTAIFAADDPWYTAVVRIILELLRVLEATHAAGVLHRDIKPANVSLLGGGRPVLLDFGHGKLKGVEAGTLTQRMFGTPAYAAPEQWLEHAETTPATDLYQVGVLLYEMLTGARCYTARETSEMLLMMRIRSGDYVRPCAVDPQLPSQLEAIVMRAMEADPRRRYASAAAFRADLEAWLAGSRPMAAAPASTMGRVVRRLGRRHRNVLMVLAAVSLGFGASQLWRRSSIPEWQFAGDRKLQIQIESPMQMIAMRFLKGDDGLVRCAPMRIVVPGKEPSLVGSLEAGLSTLELVDVGDHKPGEAVKLSTFFANPDDTAAMQRFLGLVKVMEQAQDAVRRREGDWLSEQQFLSLLTPGRGSAGFDPSGIEWFRTGSWQANGLMGVVAVMPDSFPHGDSQQPRHDPR